MNTIIPKKSGPRTHHVLVLLRDDGVQLEQHFSGLRPVVVLLLEHFDGAAERVNGLGVILVHGGVVSGLDVADLGGGVLVTCRYSALCSVSKSKSMG